MKGLLFALILTVILIFTPLKNTEEYIELADPGGGGGAPVKTQQIEEHNTEITIFSLDPGGGGG